MLRIEYYSQFKKDFKLAIKCGLDQELLKEVITMLAEGVTLPEKYRDHLLTSSKNYKNVRECHIQPDWLLIYKINEDVLTLTLIRTGSHSDLF